MIIPNAFSNPSPAERTLLNHFGVPANSIDSYARNTNASSWAVASVRMARMLADAEIGRKERTHIDLDSIVEVRELRDEVTLLRNLLKKYL